MEPPVKYFSRSTFWPLRSSTPKRIIIPDARIKENTRGINFFFFSFIFANNSVRLFTSVFESCNRVFEYNILDHLVELTIEETGYKESKDSRRCGAPLISHPINSRAPSSLIISIGTDVRNFVSVTRSIGEVAVAVDKKK